MAHVTCHLSPVTSDMTPVTCHLLTVACHLSPITCQMSHVTCQLQQRPQQQTLPLLTLPNMHSKMFQKSIKTFHGNQICGSKILSKSKIRICFGKRRPRAIWIWNNILRNNSRNIRTKASNMLEKSGVLRGTLRRWQGAHKEI